MTYERLPSVIIKWASSGRKDKEDVKGKAGMMEWKWQGVI
jgi:hypothetical protein